VQATDRAAVEQCTGVAQVVAVEEVLVHHEGAVRMPGRQCEEGRGLLRVDAGRLLAEHVLAGRERVARHLVQVRDRHRDRHGVHVVAGRQHSPVGGGPGWTGPAVVGGPPALLGGPVGERGDHVPIGEPAQRRPVQLLDRESGADQPQPDRRDRRCCHASSVLVVGPDLGRAVR
jgi:hypothetical protein